MASNSPSRFLVITQEALGLTFSETLDSSYSTVDALMQEYAYLCNERNKETKDEDGDVEGKDYEWVELPSYDDPSKSIRMKKYKDIEGTIKAKVNL